MDKPRGLTAAETAASMLSANGALTEAALRAALPERECAEKSLFDAMRYSLMAKGKRLRPALVLECFRLFSGGDPKPALPFACAVEMVHSYSLIHDDLPCMDDADLRRGRPSCHKKFGEAGALLAGDALLSHAFDTALSSDSARIDPLRVLRAARLLARASGAHGMAGGQVIDLASEGGDISEALLQELHEKKTGAMIRASACAGAILGGADEAQIAAVDAYARALGLQFQIVDDVLNVTSNPAAMGKPVGNDAESRKTTYVSLYGLEGARDKARELSRLAKESLVPLGSPETLSGLVDLMLNRVN